MAGGTGAFSFFGADIEANALPNVDTISFRIISEPILSLHPETELPVLLTFINDEETHFLLIRDLLSFHHQTQCYPLWL